MRDARLFVPQANDRPRYPKLSLIDKVLYGASWDAVPYFILAYASVSHTSRALITMLLGVITAKIVDPWSAIDQASHCFDPVDLVLPDEDVDEVRYCLLI